MTGHLLLIDVSGFAHRAYHAIPKRTRKDGLEVHAILGSMQMIWKMMGRAQADPITYAAAVFDAPGKTFRHKLYPQYKAGRQRFPGLIAQMPMLRVATECLGLLAVEAPGYEADDVIATLCTIAKREGIRTTIVGIDKDLFQLVEDNVVEIVDPVNRVRILAADVAGKFGVPPKLMPDVQALAGDSVDNILGVRWVGQIMAAKLIIEHGSLDLFLAAMDAGCVLPGKSAEFL